MSIELKPGERLDDLQRNGYKIIQDPGRFCFGMDAVLLSGFAKVKPGERVVDLGTGTGIIPILLEARSKGASFTGLEIQPESADMASRSVQLNDLQERVHIVNGDIKEAVQIFGAASCHVVTSNPPYMTAQHGLQNPDQPKAIARHEVLCTLEDVISQAAGLLMPGGRFYMVHRPFRLAEIMTGLCAHGLEPKRMQLVYPYVDREGNDAKTMRAKIATNVASEKSPVLRVMPLFVKNIAMKAAFNAVGECKACLCLSNLGVVQVPEVMRPYIERFDFVIGPQANAPHNCGVATWGDTVYVSCVRNIKEPELELHFYRVLHSLGLHVTVESNAR